MCHSCGHGQFSCAHILLSSDGSTSQYAHTQMYISLLSLSKRAVEKVFCPVSVLWEMFYLEGSGEVLFLDQVLFTVPFECIQSPPSLFCSLKYFHYPGRSVCLPILVHD